MCLRTADLPGDIYAACVSASSWTSSSCKGEPEVISVKAPQTIIRFNTFRNNSGGLTLRHGSQDIVEGNYFSGKNVPQNVTTAMKQSYGIRVIGDHHLIVNNHIENLDSISSMLGGISVLPGVPDSPLNGYWQVYDTIIAMNFVYKVQTKPVSLASDYGGSSKTVLPYDVIFSYNLMSGGTQAIYNGASETTYLGSFGFTQNAYDQANLGIPLSATTVSTVEVTPIGSTGFNKPGGSTYSGTNGLLATSSSKLTSLTGELSQISGSSDADILRGLGGFLLMSSGSVYDNFVPLSRTDVGCKFASAQ